MKLMDVGSLVHLVHVKQRMPYTYFRANYAIRDTLGELYNKWGNEQMATENVFTRYFEKRVLMNPKMTIPLDCIYFMNMDSLTLPILTNI